MRHCLSTPKARYVILLAAIAVGASAAIAVASRPAAAGQQKIVARYLARGGHTVPTTPGASIAALAGGVSNNGSIPAFARDVLSGLSSASTGIVDITKARVLLAQSRSWGGTIYAAPSSSGEACFFIIGGPATCADSFNQTNPVAFTKFDRDGPGGEPVVLAGLAPNDVTAIDVTAGADTYSAELKNNAFFYELPTSETSAVTGLTIHYTDGTSLVQPLAPLVSEPH